MGGDFAESVVAADGRIEDFAGIDSASGAETDLEVDSGVGIDNPEVEIADFEDDNADFEAGIVDFEAEIVDSEADDCADKNHHFADRADSDRLGFPGNFA